MLNRLLTILLTVLSVNISFSQKNLRDSLLVIYSDKELKEMSLDELANAVRKLRGQDTLPHTILNPKWPTEDQYGFKIIKNVNSDSLENIINARVLSIDSASNSYTLKIFPNSYVDIINSFEYGFYSNLKTRELRHKDYHRLHYDYEGDEAFKLIAYTNNSRRTYFLDDENLIRKIIIETGKNVNEGEEYDWPFPMQYQKTVFYIWNGDLQYVKQLFLGDNFNGDLSTLNENDSLVSLEVQKYYFFQNNCISSYKANSYLVKSADVPPDRALKYRSEYCNNDLAAHFQNYVKEYLEYVEGANDYLKPHEGSYTQPVTILPDDH